MLCFSKDKKIREFIFNKLDLSWIKSSIHKEIYDKVYIHLKSTDEPQINIIVEQINNKEAREKLIELMFDENKFEPSYEMTIDCIVRLEQSNIQNAIDVIREKLKNIDDEVDNTILNQLASLEKNIQDIKNKYNEE